MCEYGDIDMVKFYLENERDDIDLDAGLIDAIIGGHIEICELLLNAGANIYKESMDGAIRIKNIKVIKLLIEKGASCEKLDMSHLIKLLNCGLDINLIKESIHYGTLVDRINAKKQKVMLSLINIVNSYSLL
jgi:ankyrin repeat protein